MIMFSPLVLLLIVLAPVVSMSFAYAIVVGIRTYFTVPWLPFLDPAEK